MAKHSLDQLSAQALADAADDNFAVHATWALHHTVGMRVSADQNITLADCGLPCDTFNIICRARLDGADAPHRIRAAIDGFQQVGRPFSWWVGPGDRPPQLGALLIEAGLERADSELAMAADLDALRPPQTPPDGLDIRRVSDRAALQDYVSIIAPADDRYFYERAASALLSPHSPQWRYVGYLDDQPVATAELTVGGGIVGLYNIVTLEAYRRRGIGMAMTLRPLLDAHDNGWRTAVLQAAAAGVSIYSQLGFAAFGAITEYKPPADAIGN